MKSLRQQWRVVATLSLVIMACAGYWWHLLGEHREQITFAEEQTRLRASQVSQTLAAQVGSQMSGLEYLARSLAVLYDDNPERTFTLATANALATFPPESITQIAVADAQGRIVYSSLVPSGQPLPEVSIAERAHFLAHAHAAEKRLFISRPVQGLISGKWSVQMSYPVEHDGRFAGAVVLSINPEYLSRHFREVFTRGKDVALLVREDGAYLARSHVQSEVLDQSIPNDREFLNHPERNSGTYEGPAPIDGVDRMYAWQRVGQYPLVVSVGLGREQALQSTLEVVHQSQLRNATGTAVVLIASLWIASLFVRQRRTQARLERHRQRYRLALDGGKLGTWDWPSTLEYMHFDAAWARLLGLPHQARSPSLQALQDLIHPEDWPAWAQALHDHRMALAETFETESRFQHSSGRWIWLHLRGRVFRSHAMQTAHVAGTYADVTARHAAEDARNELQQRLSKLLSQVPGMVYQFRVSSDGTASFPYASPAIVDIYGLSPEAALQDAQPIFDSIHPDDREAVLASVQQSSQSLQPWQCEWRQRRQDGSVRWLAGRANPEREADGGTLWHGYVHDVTEQHTMVEALQHSEARLRLTMAAVQDGVWEWDTESDTITMDARCAEILGYGMQPQGVPFADWTRLLHPNDSQTVLTTLQRQVALGQPFDIEVRLRTQEGHWKWVEIRGQAAPVTPGMPLLVIGTQTDITQRKQEAHLRQALLDNAAAALLITTPERTIALANQRAVEAFSEDGMPLQGQSTRALHRHEAAFVHFQQYADAARQNGNAQVEYLLRTASGALRWFSMRGTPLDPDQPEGDTVWTLVDTTERRETEEALATARAHLLEVIQHFPGGVLVQNQSGKAVVINQTMCDLIGTTTPPEELVGWERDALKALVPAEVLSALPPCDQPVAGQTSEHTEVMLQDGRTVRVECIPMRTGRGDDLGQLWLGQDITERRRHERTLERLAATDTLTGLANRRAFMARLEAELTHVAHGAPCAMLLMLDLDHFKRVNDTWGHATGDKVLVHLAKLLRGNLLRKEDIAGRLGGEEFAVLLPSTNAQEALAIGERLRQALEQSQVVTDAGEVIRVTMSIGVSTVMENSADTLARADAALYEAKNTGRNKVVMSPPPAAELSDR
ncbi:PAS domain-containing protein [Acidovorax sp. DW039]|uniref:diguanylate cyclase n=1 Tax=Acidovorax sp. DW039 TaxID=3095606 RepID=UPI0030879D0F|nr:PAS domain-containing protein [Acidovorax sp. DW039]